MFSLCNNFRIITISYFVICVYYEVYFTGSVYFKNKYQDIFKLIIGNYEEIVAI